MADILAVFAHPDDEVLGCGGTLAKHAENGGRVFVRILSSRSRELSTHASEAFLALGLANHDQRGPTPFECGSLEDQRFDTAPLMTVISLVETTGVEPDIVYTHHPDDLNQDHALVAQAVLTAFRPKPDVKPCRIMACEVASSTEWTFPPRFQPNWFEALTRQQVDDKKRKALECYESEIRQWPHPRSSFGVLIQAQHRGQQAGVEYAEAFQLLRAGPF